MRKFLAPLLGFLMLLPTLVMAEQYEAGKQYIVLEQPVRPRNPEKIEVVELFWYGCPHCFHFETNLKQWQSQQAGDVDFWRSPAIWNDKMRVHAQMFYTAEALGILEKTHDAIFTAMNVEHKTLATAKEQADFFAQFGVSPESYTKTFESFAVANGAVPRADARARGYKISGTPEIVVAGKYRVSGASAGGQAEMLKVVDFLVAKERQEKAAKTH